jgi:hypothetical protein
VTAGKNVWERDFHPGWVRDVVPDFLSLDANGSGGNPGPWIDPDGYRCAGDPDCGHAVDRHGELCPTCWQSADPEVRP